MRKNIANATALIILALASSLAWGAEAITARGTIQEFYERYLRYDYRKAKNNPRPTIQLSKSFSEDVKKNVEICAKYVSGPCAWGDDGDEYLDTQETDPHLSYKNSGIQIQEIKPKVIQVKLNVYPSIKDAKGYYDKTITYQMVNENGKWVVDDVMYSDGISTRKRMAEDNAFAIAHPDPDAPAARKSRK